jgi:excisionase family DNA binding protein
MLANENKPLLRAMARELADILADALIKDLRADILKRLPPEPIAETGSQSSSIHLQIKEQSAEPRTLWTLRDLAQDSGIKVSTWRRWILERRIPVVRIGRSVRIKDEDYRKLIQKGYRKAIIAGGHLSGG